MKKIVLGTAFVLVMLTALVLAARSAPPAAASPMLGFTPTFTPPPTETPTVTPTATPTEPPPEPTSPPAEATATPGAAEVTPAPDGTPTPSMLLPETGGAAMLSPSLWAGVALLGSGLLAGLFYARRRSHQR